MSQSASELAIAEKWDSCVERHIKYFGVGALTGALAAALLFKHNISRAAAVAFSAGTGIGIAYAECRADFDKLNRTSPVESPKESL
mmetsp:Transcript_45912/g.74911  ORF Transcript_45912/g.74911 Transcript_45912/m.74911 type:complete len:86 (+) Transcript_45912:115-372(+)|eukprot:CAMPEP_0184643512 /NCGR_PEP_ID=MMETSP0308-20130426/371_1 /TAXON_ID=38269 /ORGANISM="Gloeochaete witrockiana, Strain SAG 46.84" /LENGTH=85 /DNA_ID=CAMNT_0027071503 /DNA_START=95 /DNA_END=352 /DNA_ORIENTATION=+